MKLYRTLEGEWVGTQADAGNKNAIEVPTDKPSLLAWLNENAAASADDSSHCPVCNLDPATARERAERIVEGMMADSIASYLEECPHGRVADVFVALANRYQEKIAEALARD